MPADDKTASKKATRTTSAKGNTSKTSQGLSEDERAAARQRVKELKSDKADGAIALREAIAGMQPPDRALAERLHAVITASVPALAPKTWYGMPAYANQAGKIVCFFQPAHKFKTRYATLGFNDSAHLDDGALWPVAYALTALTAADEQRIIALVKQAAS